MCLDGMKEINFTPACSGSHVLDLIITAVVEVADLNTDVNNFSFNPRCPFV